MFDDDDDEDYNGQEPCVSCDIWVMDYFAFYSRTGSIFAAWKKVLDLNWEELYPEDYED